MHKRDLRQKYKALRLQLSENEIQDKSLDIANNLTQIDIWNKTYFHLFLPIISLKEVNTECVLQLLFAKDKEVVLAKSDFETRQMTHFLLTENTKISNNNYNIPEPQNGLQVPTNAIEVVFVPLLAFDIYGNRVGYGKGFYDNFLADCQENTIKIGLSFFEPENQIEDVLLTDVKLDYCVTPLEVYRF